MVSLPNGAFGTNSEGSVGGMLPDSHHNHHPTFLSSNSVASSTTNSNSNTNSTMHSNVYSNVNINQNAQQQQQQFQYTHPGAPQQQQQQQLQQLQHHHQQQLQHAAVHPHTSHNSASVSAGPHHGVVAPRGNADFCKLCGMDGCDVKVLDCGCFMHARCTPVIENSPLTTCPVCKTPARALFLIPMNFKEIDQAKTAAASMAPSQKRGKKRKNATIARLNPTNSVEDSTADGSDLRTGRWTVEETSYCDTLIDKFETGQLPLMDGAKLNDFLSSMLKSKQSRLTKKMKNARLSAKTYKLSAGHITDVNNARQFSELESSFFESIQCDLERAEIRFHMQKEWREMFSSYCVAIGQKLDADQWLSSVEEMDRRASQAKDAARMARRKVMMGYALTQDTMNTEQGVFIDRNSTVESSGTGSAMGGHASTNSLTALAQRDKKHVTAGHSIIRNYSSPFVGKVIQYIHRHNIPFEHIDAWVPSYVPSVASGGNPDDPPQESQDPAQKCRLCFAGCATADMQIPTDTSRPGPLDSQDQFDLLSFGEYSQKFSFDVGCGLPGRVYSSGICSWEQGVENAPSRQFERCGGASQWGIKTVLGVPVPSPNVGRIVVLFYSRFDRTRDPEMVRRITEELTKLMPTPKWKLVVDIAAAPPKPTPGKPVDPRLNEILKLMSENVPTHKNSPYSPYLPGFTSLRLLLMKQSKTPNEDNLLATIMESYSAYLKSGRDAADTAWRIANDYMLLSQTSQGQQPNTNQMSQQIASQNAFTNPASNVGNQQQHNFGQQQPQQHQNQLQNINLQPLHQGNNDANVQVNNHLQQQEQQGMLHLADLLQQQAYSPALTPILPPGGPNLDRATDGTDQTAAALNHLARTSGFSLHQSTFGNPAHNNDNS